MNGELERSKIGLYALFYQQSNQQNMSPVPTSDNSSNPMGAPPGSDPMQARPPPSSTSELPTAALELAAKVS